ncbi:unnamed protein product [Mytilus edulis]|uniref:Mab-21-like nucleotidyltransferase domain-containing protein n=1 Tax=Mytilus edulis TaxID=6550 RepID=A0A8S3Q7B6_MYTED|nr:unnamed protein product [Mytilus edulis]
MDNQNDLQFLSVKLYHHLSDVVVGSEKAVNYRRYFYKCFDETSLFGHCKVISSGSKAEGLDLPGSDMDYMFLPQGYMVEEKLGNTKEQHLVLDTDNALPGFALIKISDNSDFIGNINVIQTVDGQLLKNDILKQSRFQVMNEAPSMFDLAKVLKLDVQTLFKVQGPAITTAIEGAADVDFVYCLPCREWPSIAKRWLHRSRCFKWPSSDLITEAIHEGVLLVPVGSKSPSSEENNTEWRQNNTEGMNSAIMMLREAVEKSPQLDASSISRNYWFLGNALSLIGNDVIECIETVRSMISALKPFDVTGLIQYWTADFENIISPLLKIYRKDS